MLHELSGRQETYRSLIRSLRAGGDRSFEDALLSTSVEGLDEEQLIAVCTVLFELEEGHGDRIPQETDVLWAQQFIDHADTLGWELRRKQDVPRDESISYQTNQEPDGQLFQNNQHGRPRGW